jgi:hypothetical protein
VPRQQLRIGDAVVVGQDDERGGRGGDPHIPRGGRAFLLLVQIAQGERRGRGEVTDTFRRVVVRRVVADDYLELVRRESDLAVAFQHSPQLRPAIVRRHHHADLQNQPLLSSLIP